MPLCLPTRLALVFSMLGLLLAATGSSAPLPIRILFLGDNGHHQPAARFEQLQPILAARGIELTYSDHVSDLNPKTLAAYDGLVVYANTDEITPEQEKALLEFVASGKGFVPLHCASYCFRNSSKYVELVGAQFLRHGTGTFRTTIAQSDHPLMKGFGGFESWDETYVHTKHNEKGRVVLETRTESDGKEPWTWVRTHGKGRVFYTAWGHDERTWSNPGFHSLIERGIRWAVGQDPTGVPSFADRPEMTPPRKDTKPFEYVEADVPFYPPSRQWGTLESGKRKMQLPLDAEESMKHLVTPVGFEVQLFASEPMIGGKPLCMTWDERGRLYVAESYDYPNELQPPGQGRDRIRVLEDTDGDGRADKSTVFADTLSIPTALAICRGGVICQNGTETVYLKDHDGDGVADERRVLITGWALGDTHGGVSNFRYGLDNWYYAMQGYNNSQPVLTDGRKVTSFRQGFFRFKVEGDGESVAVTDLEFLRSTNNNTWGLGISEEGIIFGSTANGNPSEYMPIANRYYEAVRGWSSSVLAGIAESNKYEPITPKVRQVDFHGGFTAAAGHALYTARNYPREYWNRAAFVAEPTGHLIATFILQTNGAGFRSKNSWNLLASDDEWTAPIMAEVGPDGNVWVVDWYNYIVQHNPTPAGFKTGKGNAYEIPLRDKKHGRVYRLVYTGKSDSETAGRDSFNRKPQASASDGPETRDTNAVTTSALAAGLRLDDVDQLLVAIRSDNMFWRLQAQRLLVERGKPDVVPALVKLARDANADEIGLNTGVNHSLWTLHGLGAFDGVNAQATAGAIAAIQHKSAGVRRNALQVLPHNEASLQAILQSGALKDGDSQVRLAALLAVAKMPPAVTAAESLVDAFADSGVAQDHWLADAVTSAAARHDRFFLACAASAVGIGKAGVRAPSEPNSRARRARTPLQALDRVAIVAEHYARGVPADSIGSLIVALSTAEPPVAETIIAGLAKGWPKDKPARLDPATEEALVQLIPKVSPVGRGQLVSLATRWGSRMLEKYGAEIVAAFLAQVHDEKLDDKARIAAAGQFIDFRRTDREAAGELLKLLSPRTSPELATGLIESAGRSEAASVGSDMIAAMPSVTPAVRQAAVRTLLGRAEWTQALLDALDNGKIQLGELSLDQRQALAAHPDRRIADRAKRLLARGGGLPSPDRQKVLDELLPLTKRSGDVAAGKEVFKKNCAKCHTHSGEGTKIGPDLSGVAVHPKEHLLTEMIDPSRSVEGNFRVYTIALKDGRIMSGLLASESKTALELFDSEGKKQDVQREDIDEMIASTKSLMPEGFEKQVSPDEIANLLEFLAARLGGKYLPLDLRKVATVVSTRGMFNSEEADVERLIFRDWSPKTVEGVPFVLVDPQGDRVPNAILLNSRSGNIPPKMPNSVTLPCNSTATAIHFLSGVSGWGFPYGEKDSVTMIVRLHYADGSTEDHELKNGVHFADYIRVVDVPESKLAFRLRGQQIRYFAVHPKRSDTIERIDLIKGPDATAPVVMAVTIESGE